MSILQLSPVKIGQAGVQPSSYKMLTKDNLAAIMVAGYLKQGTGGQFFVKNDLIEVIYNYGTPTATNVELYVSIDTNGVITLNVDLPGGLGTAAFKNASDNTKPTVSSVSGATVLNHVAKFSDTSGTVTDGGVLGTAAAKAASDNTKATLASVSAATTAGHVATFSDTAGTVQDGGALGQAAFKGVSDNTKANVSSVFGATVVGNVLQASDVNGTVQDSGFSAANIQNVDNIIANVEASGIGGTGLTYTVPVPRLTASSIVTATLQVASNGAAAINTCTPALNAFTVKFTADPGLNSVIQYVCVVSAQ
jgi:hypothetical protein